MEARFLGGPGFWKACLRLKETEDGLKGKPEDDRLSLYGGGEDFLSNFMGLNALGHGDKYVNM